MSHIKFTKIFCEPITDRFFYNYSCYLKAIDRYRANAFLIGHLKEPVRKVTINGALFTRNDKNIYRPWLINITVDACKVLNMGTMGTYHFYAKLVYNLLRRNRNETNVLHSCPFEVNNSDNAKNFLLKQIHFKGKIFAKNIYINADNIPGDFIPNNYYKAEFKFYHDYPQELFGRIIIYAEIIETTNAGEKRNFKRN